MTKLKTTGFFAILMTMAPAAWAGTSSTAGLPNPASAACVQAGGKLQILDTRAGQDGFCELGSGLIGEWTLWDALHARETDAVQAYLAHVPFVNPHPSQPPVIGMANPASVYCGQVGGASEIVTDAQGNQLGICTFSDGSEIEEWTLFRGPSEPGQQKLTDLLTSARRA